MANYKRKQPKLHTVYMCGMKCKQDKARMSGNHPRMRSIRDRKLLFTLDEQYKEYRNAWYSNSWSN